MPQKIGRTLFRGDRFDIFNARHAMGQLLFPAHARTFKRKAPGMKIAVACDHRGYEPKRKLLPFLNKLGHEVVDVGCDSNATCDYPDFAVPAARAVAAGSCDVGILLDGSGIGMSVTANKIRGVRAALVHDEVTARRSREHNHCNILCLGTDLLSEDLVRNIVEIFLGTPHGDGRYVRRVEKIKELETSLYRQES